MKASCSWCGADLGQRPGPVDQVTHGICRQCAAKELAKIGLRVERDAAGVARPVKVSKVVTHFFCAPVVGVHPNFEGENTAGTKLEGVA